MVSTVTITISAEKTFFGVRNFRMVQAVKPTARRRRRPFSLKQKENKVEKRADLGFRS